MLKRTLFLAYGVACYAVALPTFAYAAGFLGGFWVPRPLDAPPNSPTGVAR